MADIPGRFTVVLDMVYPSLMAKARNDSARANATPSIEVKGGTVNIYGSNKAVKPTGKSEMTLLSTSPLAEGVHVHNAAICWLFFETDTSSPVVETLNLIDTGAIA